MHFLKDYLFNYDPKERLWYAFKYQDSEKYFSGNRKVATKNPEMEELITEILVKNSRPNGN